MNDVKSEERISGVIPRVVNGHGDRRIEAGAGHGIDIASQRADDLDELAIAHLQHLRADRLLALAADLGCGQGAQAVRMARTGATTYGVDLAPLFGPALAAARAESLGMTFITGDLRQIESLLPRAVNVIVCQRTLHYFNSADVHQVLAGIRRILLPGGRFYASASGIDSELGLDYAGRSEPPARRYRELAPAMADKHNIRGPVCLYNEDEFAHVLQYAGFAVDRVYRSSFGNIKAVARARD